MAETGWKSLLGIPEYLAKIHLEKAKREKNHFKALSAANPQGMEKYFVLRCSLTCCRSALFHRVAVCLRASVVQLLPRLPALLFQLLRWWWLTLLANRSSFYAASRVTCSRRIQHESDWCSTSAVLNDEPDWSTVLVSWRSVESNKGISWRSVESNKGIGGSAREISSFAFCVRPRDDMTSSCMHCSWCAKRIWILALGTRSSRVVVPLGLLVKIRQAFPLKSQSMKKVNSWRVHAWRAWDLVEFPAWRNASDCETKIEM